MSEIICNICGGREFVEFKNRGKIRCVNCKSIERTRVFWMFFQKYVKLRTGMKVLHFAPENFVSRMIADVIGDSYDARDLNPGRYKHVPVKKFNLCRDTESLQSNHYDLIIHNHVLEHLPCNITAVLWHLHRALRHDGLHMFSIPIHGGRYDESLDNIGREGRLKRFHQDDHVRRFGRDGIADTLGMVFDLKEQFGRGLLDHFSGEELSRFCIPEARWDRFTGSSVFMFRKGDLKLAL